MGTLAITAVRIALAWIVLDSMRKLMSPDGMVEDMQDRIKFWRKWNERIGRHIIELEKHYAEMVL